MADIQTSYGDANTRSSTANTSTDHTMSDTPYSKYRKLGARLISTYCHPLASVRFGH